MADKKTGGHAFPVSLTVGPNGDLYPSYPGMDLRDYFAGQALAGLCSHTELGMGNAEGIAGYAYQHADAMIEARNA